MASIKKDSTQLIIEDLKKETKVSDEQLDTRIDRTDLPLLARFFENIDDGYLQKMNLNPGQQTDVRGRAFVSGTAAGMMLALQLWLNSQLKGTYRALIVISLSLGRKRDAVKIFKYLSKEEVDVQNLQQVAAHTQPVTTLPVAGSGRPKMEELRIFKLADTRKIDLVVEIGADYQKLGYILLNSDKKVENIKASKLLQVESIVDEILREWLKGSGKTPVTWDTLVEALRESGLVTLADDVNSMLK